MDAIKKLLEEIRGLNPDEIRGRLKSLSAEEKELRRILRLRLGAEKKKEAAPCRK